MMKRILAALFLSCLPAFAGTVTPTWNFNTAGITNVGNKLITITPIAKVGIAGTNYIVAEPLRGTLTNGVYSRNLENGFGYRVEVKGFENWTLTNWFATNVTGAVDATSHTAVITNLGSILAYSTTASDARYAPIGSAVNTNSLILTNDSRSIALTNSNNLIGASYVDLLDGSPTYKRGRIFYDTNQETLAVYNENSAVTMNVGAETWIRVVNKTGSTIPDASPVAIIGAQGQLPKVGLASATNTTYDVIGLATMDITNNGIGYVTIAGVINEINTSAYTDGDMLYLGDAPGTITTNASRDILGTCVYSHNVHGKILVAITHNHATTYTNTADVAGLVSAGGIGTNTTHLVSATNGYAVNLTVRQLRDEAAAIGGGDIYLLGSAIASGAVDTNYLSYQTALRIRGQNVLSAVANGPSGNKLTLYSPTATASTLSAIELTNRSTRFIGTNGLANVVIDESGNITTTGTNTAAYFVGDGSGLTNLTAEKFSYPFTNEVTGDYFSINGFRFLGGAIFDDGNDGINAAAFVESGGSGNYFAAAGFFGNGAGLTNLQAAHLSAAAGVAPIGTIASNAIPAPGSFLMSLDGANRNWSTNFLQTTNQLIFRNPTLGITNTTLLTATGTVLTASGSAGSGSLVLSTNGNTYGATNYSTKLRVGGAAETSDAVNITGTLRTSGLATIGSGIVATYLSLDAGLNLIRMSSGALWLRNGSENAAINLGFGPNNTAWPMLFPRTNSGPELALNGIFTATNGITSAYGFRACSTNLSVAMAANTYTNFLNGFCDNIKQFGGVNAGQTGITNNTGATRDFYVSVNVSFSGAGGSSIYEGAVFMSGVEQTAIEFLRDVSATVDSASTQGVITMTNGAWLDFRMKSPDAETMTAYKVNMTVMGAN